MSSRVGGKLPLPLYANTRLHIMMSHRNHDRLIGSFLIAWGWMEKVTGLNCLVFTLEIFFTLWIGTLVIFGGEHYYRQKKQELLERYEQYGSHDNLFTHTDRQTHTHTLHTHTHTHDHTHILFFML